jgi:hypothetical protein
MTVILLIVQDTVVTIVNYNDNTFIVESTDELVQ